MYTTTETDGFVELCVVLFDPPSGVAPRDFTLTITTTDGTASKHMLRDVSYIKPRLAELLMYTCIYVCATYNIGLNKRRPKL